MCIAECAWGDYLTVCCVCMCVFVCEREQASECMSVCIGVFVDLFLRRLTELFLCVLTHVCLYVPCRYHTAGAELSKPKSDSLYSTLCDILPFIFPL